MNGEKSLPSAPLENMCWSDGNPTVSSNGRGDNHQTLLQLANTDSGEQVGSQADTTSSTTVQTHNHHHHAKPSSM